MTEPLLTPPYAAPWTWNREGAVKAGNGLLLGYSRWDSVGQVPQCQAAARFFAASPALADAAVRLHLATGALVAALEGVSDREDALTGAALARAAGQNAIRLLLDPALRPDAGFNAPVHQALQLLQGASK